MKWNIKEQTLTSELQSEFKKGVYNIIFYCSLTVKYHDQPQHTNRMWNFPPWSSLLVIHPCRAQKSKSPKASCCSAERLKGFEGGDRIGWSWVNSLSKLLTSMDSLIDGRNGGFIFLASRASQSMVCETTLERCCSYILFVNGFHCMNQVPIKCCTLHHCSLHSKNKFWL